MKQKKAWIRIIEAFVTILLITGILLIVLNKGYISKNDNSEKIYEDEQVILREIQLNNSLRQEILNIGVLPVEWNNLSENVKNKIIFETPSYLNCEAKICSVNEICVLNEISNKDIYVQKTIITATLEKNNPRQLKLFCWRK
jgi:hypothetical protein|tara:strand:- start:278 stop:703 length:426 start_codon:yes stop_codon:yes gene_type:complete